MRKLLLALVLLPLLSAPTARAEAPIPTLCAVDALTGAPQCCKRCTTGKACGDTCIAKDKRCTKTKGCACNA